MNIPLSHEITRIAAMVVCPMCDEKKCVGRQNCTDLQRWYEEKLKEMTQEGV